MRDHHRLAKEIELLSRHFGQDRVYWDRRGDWIMVKEWPLPPNLSSRMTNILVIIPPNFGNGEPIRDAFIDPEIKVYDPRQRQYVLIPHYFKEYPYTTLQLGQKKEWREKQWQYICIHDKLSGSQGNIINYLSHVYKFLADPFRDWQGTFTSYGR